MYLISLYFDEKTNKRIQDYIHTAASASHNYFMTEHNVPPHITIAAFETLHIEDVRNSLQEIFANFSMFKLQWVSIGVFKSSTLFIQPVLNQCLQELSVAIHEKLAEIPDTKINRFYQPFHWLPHTTIAKQLNEEQLFLSFQALRKQFSMFEGKVVRVELARKTPFEIIEIWEV